LVKKIVFENEKNDKYTIICLEPCQEGCDINTENVPTDTR